MRNVTLIIFIAFIFNACAVKDYKDITPTSNKIEKESLNKVIQKDLNEEDFEDAFADEFTDETTELFDPLSGYNKIMTSFNDIVFINVFDPVANGYAYVIPEKLRIGVSNFFDNLLF